MTTKETNAIGFNSKVLASLMAESHMPPEAIGNICGVAESTVRAWMRNVTPNAANRVKLTDCFCVAEDFFWRDELTEREVIKAIRRMRAIRRTDYEEGLRNGECNADIMQWHETPYPYNLYGSVFGKPWTQMITKEQEKGLRHALSLLQPRERKVIESIYRDHCSYEEAGVSCDFGNISRSKAALRAFTTRAKAVKKLKASTLSPFLRYGLDGGAEVITNIQGESPRF